MWRGEQKRDMRWRSGSLRGEERIRSGVGKVGRHQTVIDQLELAQLDNKVPVGTCRYLLSVESGRWKVESAKGGGSLEGRHFGTASLQAA